MAFVLQPPNPVIAIPATGGVAALVYSPDITPPVLAQYTLDYNELLVTLTLTFGEPVLLMSFNVTAVLLQVA